MLGPIASDMGTSPAVLGRMECSPAIPVIISLHVGYWKSQGDKPLGPCKRLILILIILWLYSYRSQASRIMEPWSLPILTFAEIAILTSCHWTQYRSLSNIKIDSYLVSNPFNRLDY